MLNADQEFVSERPHLTKHQPKTPSARAGVHVTPSKTLKSNNLQLKSLKSILCGHTWAATS
jgi:hypothetical protein